MAVNLSHRKILRRVHVLPSLLTLGNFACGFFSIILCLNAILFTTRASMLSSETSASDRNVTESLAAAVPLADPILDSTAFTAKASGLLQWACIIVFLGMVFDMLDGKIARHMGADSLFGKELDSLADIVTFGVAPPVVVTTLWISVMPPQASWWGQVMIFGVVYAACAALRLARYNVQTGVTDKNLFSGLPSPAAAGSVVTFVLLTEGDYAFVNSLWIWLSDLSGGLASPVQAKARLLALFMLFVGSLMVTTIPFVHLANRYLVGRKPFAILVALIFLFAILWHEPRLGVFILFNGYLLTGLGLAAWRLVIRSPAPAAVNRAEDE
ncbi:MAG: CDP-alcohol phosphatidyltransferase family protein [Planctomycetota bacterium]|jgi:CDP-diacylglycerol--serine O-phosphatidyltransferase|nr:CDP-alcohol phosphatidyltransferase family protein [Planctomycetota bacterium]